MKIILPTVAAIICAIVLVMGNIHWKERTIVSSVAKDPDTVTDTETTSNQDESDNKETITPNMDLSYIKNWPTDAQDTFKKKMKQGEQFKIAIVGSQELGDDHGWANQLKNAMEETYGKEHLQVVTFSFDKTSNDFILEKRFNEVANEKADLVLFEPFVLNDNSGGIGVETNHDNILMVVNALKGKNEKTVIMLQPSNPIYNAINYPKQVEQLKDFAKENDFDYLDHWSAWPNPQTEEIMDYLDNESNPSEKGHEVWFTFLKDYFIAE
ncbi:SGNH/GDSL hydrolase family protein [Heyndrickxia sp. NPDC080065]|uniref:SGNH/GDSL hydrolase family protein n=1 Tax=Heyndrickxia sp. NPDC080065 TaxID=3390568 RepID=UPI003D017156